MINWACYDWNKSFFGQLSSNHEPKVTLVREPNLVILLLPFIFLYIAAKMLGKHKTKLQSYYIHLISQENVHFYPCRQCLFFCDWGSVTEKVCVFYECTHNTSKLWLLFFSINFFFSGKGQLVYRSKNTACFNLDYWSETSRQRQFCWQRSYHRGVSWGWRAWRRRGMRRVRRFTNRTEFFGQRMMCYFSSNKYNLRIETFGPFFIV